MDDDPAAVPASVLSDLWARKNLAHGGLRRRGEGEQGECGVRWVIV